MKYIKPDYGNPEYQEDLRADSIFLLTKIWLPIFIVSTIDL